VAPAPDVLAFDFGAPWRIKPFLAIICFLLLSELPGAPPQWKDMLMTANVGRNAAAARNGRRAGAIKSGGEGANSLALEQFQRDHIVCGDAPADVNSLSTASRKAARRHQNFRPPRPAIADNIITAFKKLIDQSQAREEATNQERKQIAKARAEFEHEFRHVMAEVITPTLNEIGSLLQQSGWTCETIPLPSDIGVGVSFEAFLPEMKAVAGDRLPRITFFSAPDRLRLDIDSLALSSAGGRPEYPLKEVSGDFVAHHVLLFFHRLTDEWARRNI
jgi:hypothetical protein